MAELHPDLGCWARSDSAPPFTGGDPMGRPQDWVWQCGEDSADDLGLCKHHRAAILGQPALAATHPTAGTP